MNAAKVTLTSTILAAALGLALGLAAVPAMADQPIGGVHGPHGDDEGDVASPLDLEMDFPSALSLLSLPCTGTTVMNTGLTADFFNITTQDCSVSLTFNPPVGVQVLYPSRVGVKTKKSGLAEVLLYFTTNPNFFLGDRADVYVTDGLDAITNIDINTSTITVGPLGAFAEPFVERIRKLHQPNKGFKSDESITFGPFIYCDGLPC